MEANEGACGGTGSAGDQSGSGGIGDPGDHRAGSRGPRSMGGKDTSAGGASQVKGTLHGSAQEGAAGGQASHLLECILTVHFLSFLEAEVARRSLISEPFRREGHEELRVTGCDLIVQLTANNPGDLQVSVTSFLNHLSEVMHTMQQQIGASFFAKPQQGRGG